MIRSMSPWGLLVEVGSASGVTAARVADAQPGRAIICVDTFADHNHPAVIGSEPCRIDHWRKNRRPNMYLWVGSLRSLTYVAPRVCPDVILVDADHAYASALEDLRASAGWLMPGGLLFVHDCDDPGHPGVSSAVEQFARETGYRLVAQRSSLRLYRKGVVVGGGQ